MNGKNIFYNVSFFLYLWLNGIILLTDKMYKFEEKKKKFHSFIIFIMLKNGKKSQEILRKSYLKIKRN